MFKVTGLKNSKLYPIKSYKYPIDWDKAPSAGQKTLQNFLYQFWRNDIVLKEFRIPASKLRCDIFNLSKKIIVEYSPVTHHGNFNPFFHKNRSNYRKSITRDFLKEEWAEKNNIKFVEITEEDLDKLSLNFFYLEYEIYL